MSQEALIHSELHTNFNFILTGSTIFNVGYQLNHSADRGIFPVQIMIYLKLSLLVYSN